ncbi:MAG: leucyl aminopeptidase family protein, partial [Actinobacteria bacterium]|nr:leucyl aminopeptidase family protein [Actinomycetota bacterium]
APDLIALPLPGPGDEDAVACLGPGAAEVIARAGASSQAGETTQLAAITGQGKAPGWVVLLGVGDGSPPALRRAGAALGRLAAPGHTVLTTAMLGRPGADLRAFTEGLLLGSYRFSLASRGPDHTAGQGAATRQGAAGGQVAVAGNGGGERDGTRGEVRLLVTAPGQAAPVLARATAVAGAVALARDLTNMPSARKSPGWLADEAASVAARSGLSARIWEPAELAERGFGGLLGVGAGSARPPRLIELGYQPSEPSGQLALIGKGITFDSGGLSLKPNDGMKLMKTDMAGGAAVIGAMSALAALGVTAGVTGLVPAAENLPSGSALRPGDVITHYGGRTVEVLNTDAEGRLVLADALAYADAVLAPDAMVDLATLTGAARVALGTGLGALYATDDGLAAALLAAGAASGDRLWRMPLPDEYADGIRSPIADLSNVPHEPARRAGSIDAALFLREFTGGRPWAHLDIAGPARAASDDGENTKGATGFGTRVLLEWLAGPGQGA